MRERDKVERRFDVEVWNELIRMLDIDCDPPMPGYRVTAGGLGWRLEYRDPFTGDWEWVMDSIRRDECIHAMILDIRSAREDRWGTAS